MRTRSTETTPRPLTGRTVLVCLVAFFGVVAAANAVLIRAATSTFGGLETASSYKAGLAFKDDIAAARAQEARHWRVSGTLARDGTGAAVLVLTVRDADGHPPTGLAASARLAHPADARRDRTMAMHGIGPAEFRGTTTADAGQWDLTIDLWRGEERLFRSRSRVLLR